MANQRFVHTDLFSREKRKIILALILQLEAMKRSGVQSLYATPDFKVRLKKVLKPENKVQTRPESPNIQPQEKQAQALIHTTPQKKESSSVPKHKAVIVPSVAAQKLGAYKSKNAQRLQRLAEEISKCGRCRLCSTRTQTVYSRGNPASPLMIIGEAPGADEDKQGLPFVGRAGKLLNEILSKGMGYDPDDVYIANVLKCRPPNNRNPEPDEIAACRDYLLEQVEIIDPLMIIALGRFPAQWLLESKESIGRLRGKIWNVNNRKILATYHPAYLLRNPAAKKEVWKDVQLAMDFFGRGKPLPMRG